MTAKDNNNVVFTVGASRERDYGAIKQTFSYSETFNSGNGDTQLSGYRKVSEQLDQFIQDFETEVLPKLREVDYKANVEHSNNSDNWQKALIFRREIKGNKTYYNFVTPRYPKFGIAAWEECKGRDDMIAKLGDKNEIPLDGYRVRVDESGKYPKAVEVDLQF